MFRLTRCLFLSTVLGLVALTASGQQRIFHVLAFYSTTVEQDHVDFAMQAVPFFHSMAARDHFDFETTTNWNDMNPTFLSKFQVVMWLDDRPATPAQRLAFQNYMEHGGGWLGFHIAGYMASREAWPWFANFIGTVFSGNSWPPLPAKLDVDDPVHPATTGLPVSYLSPSNEWYSWNPDPRLSPDIKVLMTLDASNYPIGFKNTLTRGDIPVVWSNTKYKMLYTNMGHGSEIFTSQSQNQFFEKALLWLGGRHE